MRRTLLSATLLVVLLVGIAFTGSAWVLGQYYVGVARGEVVVFRGVNGNFLGLPLQIQAEGSCRDGAPQNCEKVLLRDLQQRAQTGVLRGMPTNGGLDAAREIIKRLRTDDWLPLCSGEAIGQGDAELPPSLTPAPTSGLAPPDKPVTTSSPAPVSSPQAQPGGALASGQPSVSPTAGVPSEKLPAPAGSRTGCRIGN